MTTPLSVKKPRLFGGGALRPAEPRRVGIVHTFNTSGGGSANAYGPVTAHLGFYVPQFDSAQGRLLSVEFVSDIVASSSTYEIHLVQRTK